jgi:putative hydrolase of the HAD superfamily
VDPSPIEAVLFDFGGTLDADGVRWAVRFHEAYRRAGGSLDLPAFEPLFRESDGRLARHPGIRSAGFTETVHLQCALLAGLIPESRDLAWDLIGQLFCAEAIAIVRRNQTTLEQLGRRWRLGVVSNFTGNLQPCLEELGLSHHFMVVIDSALHGREKPDPHPFQAALAALETTPAASWMIGDNPEADVRPALTLGMRACWLTDPLRTAPRGLVPTARIAHLPELAGALEAMCLA